MELGTIEAVKQCAMASMGLAVLPKMAVTAELKHKRLVPVAWPGPGFPIYIQIARHSTRWISPALGALWSLAAQSLAKTSITNSGC
jgi:DNA-binding transcriptional LysR family regulator